MTVWNPSQYLQFSGERLRPALDLMAMVSLEHPSRIVDLGCGPGNVTAILAERYPHAHIQGVDTSTEMLARAAEIKGIDWQQGDAARWVPDNPVSLIYSNAALHWLADHESLLPRLLGLLEPGGQLAVQMPRNHLAPTHTAITETVQAGPWAQKLSPLVQPSNVQDPAFYYDLLAPLSKHLNLWETEYLHILEGENPVLEWTKGTALKRFLDALDDPQEKDEFMSAYGSRVADAYPRRSDGKTLMPFRRLFMIATV